MIMTLWHIGNQPPIGVLFTCSHSSSRDMYYRDPELFLKQSVVDRYVDDIAFNLGVKREALNVVSSSASSFL
jgi:meiotic recombination protein SPO11